MNDRPRRGGGGSGPGGPREGRGADWHGSRGNGGPRRTDRPHRPGGPPQGRSAPGGEARGHGGRPSGPNARPPGPMGRPPASPGGFGFRDAPAPGRAEHGEGRPSDRFERGPGPGFGVRPTRAPRRDAGSDFRGAPDRGSRPDGPPHRSFRPPFERRPGPGGQARPPWEPPHRPPSGPGPDRGDRPGDRRVDRRPPQRRPPWEGGTPPWQRSEPPEPAIRDLGWEAEPAPDQPIAPQAGPSARRPEPRAIPALGPDEELVAGRRPVEEAFAARRPAIRLLVVPHRRQALERVVLHATTLRIPIVEVEGGSLTSLAGFDGHQGVALVVSPRRFAGLDDILARAIGRKESPLVLVLDSLEDPQNVGTLLRSAEAAGVHGVVFPTERQAPLTPAAIKASAGATEHLLLCPVDDLAGTLADLHVRGVRIVGSDADAPLTAREADLRGPVAIVVGSEGHGLSPAVRRRCDLFVRIPMRGEIGSLNAAVAGSILLFEALGQRDPTAKPEPGEGRALRGEARDRERDVLAPTVDLEEAGPEPSATIDDTVAAEVATAKPKRTRRKASPPPEDA